jgi:hypothetical protein
MAVKSLLEMLEPTACKESPVLGEAIPWKQVEGQFLRVRWCRLFASIRGGMIKPAPMDAYAALGVECPSLIGEAFIVVSNEVDFRHLWDLYEQRRVADDEEVLLSHVPVDDKGFGRLMVMALPCLDIMVYPKGHFKEAYDLEFRPLSRSVWNTARARWKPSDPGIEGFCVPEQPLVEAETVLAGCLETDTVLASALALEAEQAVELQTLPIHRPQAPTTRSSKKATGR